MAAVVFMRGVNVGGHKPFRPAAFARELSALGLVNIGAAGTFIVEKQLAIPATTRNWDTISKIHEILRGS